MMKKDWSEIEKFRLPSPPSPKGATYGAFSIKHDGWWLNVIANEGHHDGAGGWDHVSVHAVNPFGKQQTPSWKQMCFIKDTFWEKGEMAIQYHPKEQDYICVHDHVLHVWGWPGHDFPMPPKICV